MTSTKIVVAMSGGVDSSVAAALLKEQGHDVIGITMQIWPSKKAFGGCCSLEAVDDAKAVAARLGIPHYVLNFRNVFKDKVINDFIEEYKNGRTPNPCIRCNQFIKFDHLAQKARELGAESVATGHYARIVNSKLLKGRDKKKDQSYVLYMMDQESLAHTLYPLGDLTKTEVRKLAKDLDLPVAEKAESQEICFVEEDDYGRFLKETYPEAVQPGQIVDKAGNVVGQHDGIAFFTLGQRKGIGHHKGQPKYVIRLDRENNAVVIGDKEDTLGKELIAEQVSYISGTVPKGPLAVMAKIRYNSSEVEAVLEPELCRARVTFEEAQQSITPGQSVVF
ncbi:MAG: tRNA 2-thiouridine(34) synthase MnmA, partial [Candidatus Margulisiibacteriota bacterium]